MRRRVSCSRITGDPRFRTAHPSRLGFATKVTLAKQLLARAFAAGVAVRWVVADCLYGRAHHFRHWLEGQGQAYVVGVLPDQRVVHDGRQQRGYDRQGHTKMPTRTDTNGAVHHDS